MGDDAGILAVFKDGTILVLEDSTGNNRIQAFDLGGNPVPFFKQQESPYFLPLDATAGAAYLDLAGTTVLTGRERVTAF